MSKPTIGILGASGFVGSALAERLFFDKRYRDGFESIAFIHGYANASRVARLPIRIETLDLLDEKQAESSLSACDFIVNCTRGDSLLMLNGLKNLIRALKKLGTKKFVHLSSVAIYGDDPPAESASEDARPNPDRTAYGDIKAAQDELIFKLHEKGIPSIILCPSNIGGPYSSLIVDAVAKLAAREIVLVDDGQYATNIVHIDNLVQAILTALESDTGWGERYFVNETEPISWKQFFGDMVNMLGIDYEFSNVPGEEVREHMKKKGSTSPGIKSQVGTLFSRDFRDAVSIIPAFKKMDEAAQGLLSRLSPRFQETLRSKLRKPMIINESPRSPSLEHKLITAQIRRVYHSPEKIMSYLKYKPLLDYRQGMNTTQKWLEFANLIPSSNPIHSR